VPFGGAPGNLRADYVLPRKNMKITDAGVFWPESTDPDFALVGTFPFHHTLTQGVADSQFTWTGAGTGCLPVAGDFGLG
jgi:hypothetical protein